MNRQKTAIGFFLGSSQVNNAALEIMSSFRVMRV